MAKNIDECNQSNSRNINVHQDQNMPSTELTTDFSLKGGIFYCKRVSEQLEKELVEWQGKLFNIKRKNKNLKDTLINLDNEKQNMIMKFHEEFRKYDTLEKYVCKLEEEIQNTIAFLENMAGLENDIRNSEVEETKIRVYILNSLRENFNDFNLVRDSFIQEIQDVQEKITDANRFLEKKQTYENVNCELKTYIAICDKKIEDLKNVENTSLNISVDIKQKINTIQNETEAEANEIAKKFEDFPKQMKLETNSVLHSQLSLLKERVKTEYSRKQEKINELRTELENQIRLIDKTNSEITKKKNEIDALKNQKKKKLSELYDLKLKVEIAEKEKEIALNLQYETRTRIQNLQSAQQTQLKEIEELKKNIENTTTKRETLKSNLEKFTKLRVLEQQLTESKSQYSSENVKHQRLIEIIQELTKQKNSLLTQIENMKNEVEQEQQNINSLMSLNKKTDITYGLENTEEQNMLDRYSSIEVEEYSFYELAELEINSLSEKLYDTVSMNTDLEISLLQIQKDKISLDARIEEKQKMLKSIMEDHEFCKISIHKLKQNVYQGKYITQQELNKKYNIMVNGKNVETEKISKLREEIKTLTDIMNSKKKDNQHYEEVCKPDHSNYRDKMSKEPRKQ